MIGKNHCSGCTLYLCRNKSVVEKCFIEIINSSRPVYCHNCVISKNRESMKKFEESIQFFQKTEGNTPCFKLKSACFYLLSSYLNPPKEINGLFFVQDPYEPTFIRMSMLEAIPVLKGDEKFISSEEILKRAKEMGIVYGERAARYVLEYQQEIPKEWGQRYYNLLFPGTIRKSKEGKIFSSYLALRHDQWFLHFGEIGSNHIGSSCFFVRRRC